MLQQIQTSSSRLPTARLNPTDDRERRHSHAGQSRIIQNVRLLWVDANIDEAHPDSRNTLQNLRSVVNDLNVFRTVEDCIQFLEKISNEKALIITSGSLGQKLVPQIHHLAQVESIYIFCRDVTRHQVWTKQWTKIRGVDNQIDRIRKSLSKVTKQVDQDLIPISFAQMTPAEEGSKINPNQLEPSFMYTQLFKNILLNMRHDENERKQLVETCRKDYEKNPDGLKILEEFNREYHPNKAVWWYTRECFAYQMLNRSLRLLEAHIIVDMGFLIHDLHQQIEHLFRQQHPHRRSEGRLTLYRGQALTNQVFEKIKRSRGGLMSFNHFLSTSKERAVSADFAKKALHKDGMVGILFEMAVDPKITTTPFADIHQHSYYGNEAEVLFSMHSIFRIGEIQPLDKSGRLFQVNLILTAEDDPELRRVQRRFDQDIQGETSWSRLAALLMKLGSFDRAEKVFQELLKRRQNPEEQADYHHALGFIQQERANYPIAHKYFKHALSIKEKLYPPNHPSLATSYHDIGMLYFITKEYSEAEPLLEKSLYIRERTIPINHDAVAECYNSIGLLFEKMEEYPAALSYFEKCLAISKQIFPAYHPDLAVLLMNVARVYASHGDFNTAISLQKEAYHIFEKSVPENHLQYAEAYHEIGEVYERMGQYEKALSFYNKSLAVVQKALPSYHPTLAVLHNHIGYLYMQLQDYPKALSFQTTAVEILKGKFSNDHVDVGACYNCVGDVYFNMEVYDKALSFYNKSLHIFQNIVPTNHVQVAVLYFSISHVYYKLRDKAKALSYLQQSLNIRMQVLPPMHPDIEATMDAIQEVSMSI